MNFPGACTRRSGLSRTCRHGNAIELQNEHGLSGKFSGALHVDDVALDVVAGRNGDFSVNRQRRVQSGAERLARLVLLRVDRIDQAHGQTRASRNRDLLRWRRRWRRSRWSRGRNGLRRILVSHGGACAGRSGTGGGHFRGIASHHVPSLGRGFASTSRRRLLEPLGGPAAVRAQRPLSASLPESVPTCRLFTTVFTPGIAEA